MSRKSIIVCILVGMMSYLALPRAESSWVFWSSVYSHDAQGRRVTQYAKPAPAYRPEYDYRLRAYHYQHHHTRFGDSWEHWYSVETWRR